MSMADRYTAIHCNTVRRNLEHAIFNFPAQTLSLPRFFISTHLSLFHSLSLSLSLSLYISLCLSFSVSIFASLHISMYDSLYSFLCLSLSLTLFLSLSLSLTHTISLSFSFTLLDCRYCQSKVQVGDPETVMASQKI